MLQNATKMLQNIFKPVKYFKVTSRTLDRIRNTMEFAKLLIIGVLESLITWLLKVSRSYRYVARVLAEEKRLLKEHTAAVRKKIFILRK